MSFLQAKRSKIRTTFFYQKTSSTHLWVTSIPESRLLKNLFTLFSFCRHCRSEIHESQIHKLCVSISQFKRIKVIFIQLLLF